MLIISTLNKVSELRMYNPIPICASMRHHMGRSRGVNTGGMSRVFDYPMTRIDDIVIHYDMLRPAWGW